MLFTTRKSSFFFNSNQWHCNSTIEMAWLHYLNSTKAPLYTHHHHCCWTDVSKTDAVRQFLTCLVTHHALCHTVVPVTTAN